MRVPIEDLRLFKLLGETMNFPYQQRTTIPTPQLGDPSRMAAQDSPLGEELFFMVEQIHHEFHTRMHTALTGVGLDVRQYTTLAFIATGTGRAQNDLATILHLDPSQVVKLTKALEAAGLLTRDTSSQDRRSKMLQITDEGQELYTQATALVRQVQESLTAALSRRDRKALDSLLHRILPLP